MGYKKELINDKKREQNIKKLEEKIKIDAKKECQKLANMNEEQRKEYFNNLSFKVQLLNAELKDLMEKKEYLDSDYVADFEEDTQDKIFLSSVMICTALIGGLMFLETPDASEFSLLEKYVGGAAMTGLSAIGGVITGFFATFGISLRPISNLSLKLKKIVTNSKIKKVNKKAKKATNKFEIVKERYTPSEEKSTETDTTKKQILDRPLKTFEILQYEDYERRYGGHYEK